MEKWLEWAIELQSLAQAGLTYGKDIYDKERYERIRAISAEIISNYTDIAIEKVKDLFCNETGYQTPKLDTRAAIFEDGKILLVRENNGKWSLPGGWVDVNVSVKENTIKEVKEESAQAYFDSLFFDESEPNCTLADIALVNPVRPLAKDVEARYFEMATLPTNGCIPTGDFIKPYNGGVRFINGDTLIARITPCLENGKAAYINILEDNEVAFGSTEYIVFASKGNMPSSFYYFLIRNAKFVTFALQFMNGSSGRQRVSGEELASFPLCRPSCENLEAFDKVASLVLEQMKDNTYEIQKLKQLQEVIAATISSC